MALINCKKCGKEISSSAKKCIHCGYVEKLKIICAECNFQNSPNSTVCKNCGSPIGKKYDRIINLVKKNFNFIKKIMKKNKRFAMIGIVGILIIGGIIVNDILNNKKVKDQETEYNNRAIKVDISMTNYYGSIEFILYELGLDFDLVTMGATCNTGVQKGEFRTEKFGILHTEFRYCAYNDRQTFRVYNDEKDQPLREPKPGELATFDAYGKKTSNGKM